MTLHTKPEKRRPAPLAVKLENALDQLGDALKRLGEIPPDTDRIEWEHDHFPALALRPFDPTTGHHIPHQHSAGHLRWLPKACHKAKTTGRRGESKLSARDGDAGKIAKVRRIEKKRAAADLPREERPRIMPKAKIPQAPKKPRKAQKRASGYVRRGV